MLLVMYVNLYFYVSVDNHILEHTAEISQKGVTFLEILLIYLLDAKGCLKLAYKS